MSKDNESNSGPFFEAFSNFGRNLNLPNVTIDSVVEHHRKNIQAMQQAAKNTTDGAQAIMAVQRKALEETLADITQMVENAQKGGMTREGARDAVAAQMEFSKRAFDATIRNAGEVSSILQEQSGKNFEILKNRVQESIEEMKTNVGGGDEPPVKPG